MKIMISQPMRGKTTEQIESERKALVEKLERQGHEVVNTIFAEETPRDCDTALYYLSKSIEAIGRVDALVFMHGWKEARGCRIEHQIAVEYGKFVREEQTMNIIEKTYSLNGSLTKRTKTDTIVLHHRVGDGDVEGVDRMHKNNGWTCIGYHFYVRKDGSVYRGRQEDTVGAHAYGYNNTSIGICAEGNFENDIMSEAQKQALKELVAYIKEKYGINKVVKHNDLGNTACPGKNYPFSDIANATKTEENHTKVDNSYVVKAGDTLSGIAKKYGTTIDKLIELNKAKHPKIAETNGNFIQTGWVLNVGQETSNNSIVTYKVNANSGLWLLDINGKKIKAYAKGKEVEYIGTGYTKYGYNYVKVKVVSDGNVGYMAKTYLK